MTVIKDNLWIGWQVRNLRVGHRLGKRQAQRISVVLSFSTVPKTLICFISTYMYDVQVGVEGCEIGGSKTPLVPGHFTSIFIQQQ